MTNQEIRDFYEQLETISEAIYSIQTLCINSDVEASIVAKALFIVDIQFSRILPQFHKHAFNPDGPTRLELVKERK